MSDSICASCMREKLHLHDKACRSGVRLSCWEGVCHKGVCEKVYLVPPLEWNPGFLLYGGVHPEMQPDHQHWGFQSSVSVVCARKQWHLLHFGLLLKYPHPARYILLNSLTSLYTINCSLQSSSACLLSQWWNPYIMGILCHVFSCS